MSLPVKLVLTRILQSSRYALLVLILLLTVALPSSALAISQNALNSILNNTYFFDPNATDCGSTTGSGASGASTGTPTPTLAAFVDKYGQDAYQNSINTGVPYEFTLAQAIVESGYGGSQLSSQYNNFFGIKADSSWHGATATFPTQEYVNGSYITINAAFRAYPTAAAGFADHDAFLRNNSRYAPAFQFSNDPIKFLDAVAAAGYATSPTYAQTVGAVIHEVQSYVASKNLFPPSSQVKYSISAQPPAGSTVTAGSPTGGQCTCPAYNSSSTTSLNTSLIPQPYSGIFTTAGTKYGVSPAFLAAIFYGGEHGNSWPTPPAPYGNGPAWDTSSAGAQGPFQFEPQTWAKYGVDGNGDGKVDVQDLIDASFGAANYFANGLGVANTTNEQKLRQAAADYNGNHNPNSSYADSVWSAYQNFSNSAGAPAPSANCSNSSGSVAGVYKNPLRDVKGLRAERIDQGVDYGGSGPVYALGNGTILNLTNSGWNFGGYDGYVSERLSDGPAAGDVVYVAEACVPTVQIGEQVTSDTVICNMINPNSTGIETGWSAPAGNGQPLAQVYGGNGSTVTTVGINYNNLLVSLGAPSGLYEGNTIGDPLPASWPKW